MQLCMIPNREGDVLLLICCYNFLCGSYIHHRPFASCRRRARSSMAGPAEGYVIPAGFEVSPSESLSYLFHVSIYTVCGQSVCSA